MDHREVTQPRCRTTNAVEDGLYPRHVRAVGEPVRDTYLGQHRRGTLRPRVGTMATRRDFILMSEVLRTTAMPSSLRLELANVLARELAERTPHFDPVRFIHEATRGSRPGEPFTMALPDSPLMVSPADLRSSWAEDDDLTMEERALLAQAADPLILAALVASVDEHGDAIAKVVDDVIYDATSNLIEHVYRKHNLNAPIRPDRRVEA